MVYSYKAGKPEPFNERDTCLLHSYRGNTVFLHSVMVCTRNLSCQHWEVLSGWELALKRLKQIVQIPANHTTYAQLISSVLQLVFYAPISGQTSDNTSLSFFNTVTTFPNDSTSSALSAADVFHSLQVPFDNKQHGIQLSYVCSS